MLRNVEADCPGCQAKVHFDVDVPDPQISVKLIEDTTRVDTVTREANEAKSTVEATRAELLKWESGENHLQAPDMLDLLTSCPNCKPTLDAFVGEVKKQAVAALTPDQVKQIAKAQRWWPPPPIELGPWLSRRV